MFVAPSMTEFTRPAAERRSVRDLAVTVINHSTVRDRLRWFAWPTLISAALLAHFLVSVGVWLFWFVGILHNPHIIRIRKNSCARSSSPVR
jgi:hypothetical protein